MSLLSVGNIHMAVIDKTVDTSNRAQPICLIPLKTVKEDLTYLSGCVNSQMLLDNLSGESICQLAVDHLTAVLEQLKSTPPVDLKIIFSSVKAVASPPLLQDHGILLEETTPETGTKPSAFEIALRHVLEVDMQFLPNVPFVSLKEEEECPEMSLETGSCLDSLEPNCLQSHSATHRLSSATKSGAETLEDQKDQAHIQTHTSNLQPVSEDVTRSKTLGNQFTDYYHSQTHTSNLLPVSKDATRSETFGNQLSDPNHSHRDPNQPLISDPNQLQIRDLNASQIRDPNEPQIREENHPQIRDPNHPLIRDPNQPQIREENHPWIRDPNQPLISHPNQLQIRDLNPPQIRDPNQVQIREENHPQIRDPNQPQIREGNLPRIRDPNQPQISDPNPLQIRGLNPPQIRGPNQPQMRDQNHPQIRDPNQLQIRDPNQPQITDPNRSLIRDLNQPLIRDPNQPQIRDQNQSRIQLVLPYLTAVALVKKCNQETNLRPQGDISKTQMETDGISVVSRHAEPGVKEVSGKVFEEVSEEVHEENIMKTNKNMLSSKRPRRATHEIIWGSGLQPPLVSIGEDLTTSKTPEIPTTNLIGGSEVHVDDHSSKPFNANPVDFSPEITTENRSLTECSSTADVSSIQPLSVISCSEINNPLEDSIFKNFKMTAESDHSGYTKRLASSTCNEAGNNNGKGIEGDETCRCIKCGHYSICYEDLLKHTVECHMKTVPCKCADCDKEIGSAIAFQYHQLKHTEATQTDKDTLNRLVFTVATQGKDSMENEIYIRKEIDSRKKHTCEICEKSFLYMYSLQKHVTRWHPGKEHSMHTHSVPVKPFGCTLCHKTFSENIRLQQHLLSHTAKQVYGCLICTLRFPAEDLLAQHMSRHEDRGKRRKQRKSCQGRVSKKRIKKTVNSTATSQDTEPGAREDSGKLSAECTVKANKKARSASSIIGRVPCETVPNPDLMPPVVSAGSSEASEIQTTEAVVGGSEKEAEGHSSRIENEKPFKRIQFDNSSEIHIVNSSLKESNCTADPSGFQPLSLVSNNNNPGENSTFKKVKKTIENGHTGDTKSIPPDASKKIGNIKSVKRGERCRCIRCGHYSICFANLLKHTVECHMKTVPCNCTDCGEEIRSAIAFQYHQLKHTEATQKDKDALNRLAFTVGRRKRDITRTEIDPRIRKRNTQKKHSCEICGKSFRDKGPLQIHFRIHTGEKPFHCAICDRKFTSKKSLAIHMHIHPRDSGFRCTLCPKTFTGNGALKQHMLSHTAETVFRCLFCGLKFPAEDLLRHHMSQHEARGESQSWRNVSAQVKIHQREKEWVCCKCGERFISRRKGHVYLCNVCTMSRDNCTIESSFTCYICKKVFEKMCNLRQHLRCHTSEKPFLCSFCGKTFKESSFHRHVRNRCSHSAPKNPACCAVCGKVFKCISALKRHERIHSAENKKND